MNTKQRVQQFWYEVSLVRQDLQQALDEKDTVEVRRIVKELNEQLKEVCGCGMDVEVSDTGFYEMSFDTIGNKTAQLCCALIKKDAPAKMKDDWIINAWIQPLSEKALHTTFNVHGTQYSGVDFKVYYTIEKERKMISLKIYCKGLVGMKDAQKQNIVSYMLELYIGTLEYEARIASVQIIDEEIDVADVCLLPNLYEDICDIIMDQDWMEYHDPLSIYQAYKLDEKPVNETLLSDRKLIVTTNPQLQEEIMKKEYDSCKEFTYLGGQYGFLYYEVVYEDEKEALVRRQLEKEINDLLYPLSVARTMGGAIGTHYSYIDVAIFDLDAFLFTMKKMNETLTFHIYYHAYM